jgi:hypothetical protein
MSPPTSAAYALLLHGRLGTINMSPSVSLAHTHLGAVDYARPIAACAASHLEHVVRSNSNARVDVFAHTWNPFVGKFFDAAYAPYLRASLHEPLEFLDSMKARSQALSIGRVARLMAAHESERKRPYTMCLVLRADVLVGAPIRMGRFTPAHVWFAEHCCLNDATEETTKAIVKQQCEARASRRPSDPRYRQALMGNFTYRKRVLGPCRVSQYGGRWGLQFKKEDFYYFVMDWWFAARPDVVRSFLSISEDWPFYKRRLQRMRIARWFSHYLWAIHLHDRLNLSTSIRFLPGVRVNLVRSAFPRLVMPAGTTSPLGEYISDAVGNCESLRTSTNQVLSFTELMRTPVPRESLLGRMFEGKFAPMAEQCALARVPMPVVCCGEPRLCGAHVCRESYAAVNGRFRDAAGRATVAALAREVDAKPT